MFVLELAEETVTTPLLLLADECSWPSTVLLWLRLRNDKNELLYGFLRFTLDDDDADDVEQLFDPAGFDPLPLFTVLLLLTAAMWRAASS